MVRATRTVRPPHDCGVAMAQVVDDIDLALTLESVMEGVWVSGTGHTTVRGECARCLEPLRWPFTFTFEELFTYPATDARGHLVDEDTDGEAEGVSQMHHDVCDIEDVVRDAIVPDLPLAPLCSADCPGLCSECGIHLAQNPAHHHEIADPRWAALDALRDREQ